jgi:hypothetical protein
MEYEGEGCKALTDPPDRHNPPSLLWLS